MNTKKTGVVILSICMMLAACCGVGAKEFSGKRGVAVRHSVVNFNQIATKSLLSCVPYVAPQTKPRMLPIPHNLPAPEGVAFNAPARKAEALPPVLNLPSPTPALDFEALADNNKVIPPDTMGAVGKDDLMVTLNSEVRIQSRTGEVKSTMPLDDFWASVGPFDENGGCFDPKVLYDPYNDRWIFTCCADAKLATSSVLIGVSQTCDPSGDWNLYRVDADAEDKLFADYPSIGFNKNWIVVQMNMYTNADDTFTASNIYCFDKNDLYTGGTGNYSLISQEDIGACQVPAITYDNDTDVLYLVQSYDSGAGSYYAYMAVYRLSGPVADPSLYTWNYIYSSDTWAPTTDADLAPQLSSDKKIDTGDDRVQNVIYRNGSLWCTHTVFLPDTNPTHSAVQWWEIASYGDVVQAGRIEDTKAAIFYAYPSIAVNKNGDAMIGFSRFSAASYASSAYAFRFATDALGTMRKEVVYKEGEAAYFKAAEKAPNRWGDYSSTCVDPVNDTDMWTIQEYAATPVESVDRWGTWWSKLQLNYTISGKVSDQDGNPLADVKMMGLPGTPVTDADGFYTTTVVWGWSSTSAIKPTKEYYLFTPANITYSKVASDKTQDYTGTFDNTPPTVTGVSTNMADAWYGVNSNIRITVQFSEPVVVTGVPKLQLELGAIDQWASYYSGSGTSTLTFTYKVKAGDTSADLDYTGTTALTLNGGRIKDPTGNAADLTLAAPGAVGSLSESADIKIDTTYPTLGAVTPSSGNLILGRWITVTSTYSDADGADNLGTCSLLINETSTSAGAAQLVYNANDSKFYMKNDLGVLSDGVAAGAPGVIETENAKLDCAASTVSEDGNNLVVSWKVWLKPTFAKKTCNLYSMAVDDSGATANWASKGQVYMDSAPTLESVSPNTGDIKAGNWIVVTCTYSDFDGAADLSTCSLLINDSLSNAKGAHFFYDHNQRRLFMKNNAGAVIPTGGVLAGGATFIESENAVLDCAGTRITVGDNSVTVAWRIKLGSTMAERTCNLYMSAKDDRETLTAWTSIGQVDVQGNSAPNLGDITPALTALTVGEWKTLSCTYTDVDGAENLASCALLINSTLANKGGAHFFYDENQNKLFMKNNAGAIVGGNTPGSLTSIETENAVLDCSSSIVMKIDNTITVSWRIMLKPAMAKKNCKYYMQTTDDGGAGTGWLTNGQLYVNSAPTVVSVSPRAGVSPKEQWVTFSSSYSDIDGPANLAVCELLANDEVSDQGGMHLVYNKALNRLFMRDNSGALRGGFAPGASGTIETENAFLDCAASRVTVEGNTVTVAWRIKMKSIMSGKTCGLYLKAADAYGASQEWTSKGAVFVNSSPQLTGVSTESGSVAANSWTSLLSVYSDLDGAVNVKTVSLLVNTTTINNGGAHFFYNENENKLYMKKNNGTVIGGIAPGTEAYIESENAVLDCAGTVVTESGCNISVSWSVKFKSTMAGKNCNLYMQVVDDSGDSQPWTSKGQLAIIR